MAKNMVREALELPLSVLDLNSASPLNKLALKQWIWVENMGWHNKQPLEYVAHIASEISEVANECRGEHPTDNLGEELADIVLRTIDMAYQFNIDIDEAIQKKMAINSKRDTRVRLK